MTATNKITAANTAPADRGNTGAVSAAPLVGAAPTSIGAGSHSCGGMAQIGGAGALFASTYPYRENIPCFGCDRPMERCVCEWVVCGKCQRTVDDYGYCGCKAENGPSVEDVRAQFARLFGHPLDKPEGWNRVEL
jgi:hypothetical protein